SVVDGEAVVGVLVGDVLFFAVDEDLDGRRVLDDDLQAPFGVVVVHRLALLEFVVQEYVAARYTDEDVAGLTHDLDVQRPHVLRSLTVDGGFGCVGADTGVGPGQRSVQEISAQSDQGDQEHDSSDDGHHLTNAARIVPMPSHGVECSVYHDKKRQQSVAGPSSHIIRSYLHSCHVGHESFCCHLGGRVPPGSLPPLVTHTIWSRPFQRLRVFGILGRHHRTQGGSRHAYCQSRGLHRDAAPCEV